jgi:DNA polymerase III delta prime subunit
MSLKDNPLWTEKYRPRRVSECVLPESLKSQFQAMVDSKTVPNLLLSGPPGVGKTTVAMAMLDELDYDVYVINGSLKGNIDTLRNEIQDFASSVSFTGSRKVVLLDEADYLNPQSTQPALRNFMEQFSATCGFVLTCNYPTRIIEPLRSRTSVIDFAVRRADKPALMREFFTRVEEVLKNENVQYDKMAVGHVINKFFPDWRRVLNELQRYSSGGAAIDAGILSRGGDSDFVALVGYMRQKDFTSVRRWIGENDVDPTNLFRRFYDSASEHVTDDSIPQLVLTIGEYQYKASHVADQEINLAAFCVHVMASCAWR